MPKCIVDGWANFEYKMNALNEGTRALLKMGLYESNKIIYAEVENRLNALPLSTKDNPQKELTAIQKKGLLEGLYGSKFQEKDGQVYFYISVDGYNDKVTEKYPDGQPNIMLLRSLEHGASSMHKHSVMRVALNHSKERAIKKMQEVISEEVARLQKG